MVVVGAAATDVVVGARNERDAADVVVGAVVDGAPKANAEVAAEVPVGIVAEVVVVGNVNDGIVGRVGAVAVVVVVAAAAGCGVNVNDGVADRTDDVVVVAVAGVEREKREEAGADVATTGVAPKDNID